VGRGGSFRKANFGQSGHHVSPDMGWDGGLSWAAAEVQAEVEAALGEGLHLMANIPL
jgi:hypothetical protein